MTIVKEEKKPVAIQAHKSSPTPSTSCSTETLATFLSGDDTEPADEVNNASFVDLDGLIDEDLLEDDDDDDSENELSENEEEKGAIKRKKKVGRIVKVRASDFCCPDGGRLDPKQFERVVKHLRSQKGGKSCSEKVPRIMMRASSKDSDDCPPGPLRRNDSSLRSMMRRQRAESLKEVKKDPPKAKETERRKPLRKISSISLDSFKSVLKSGKKKSKKTSSAKATGGNVADEKDSNKTPTPFPRTLKHSASSGKSSRWGTGSEHGESPQKRHDAAPPSRPTRPTTPTMSPGRSTSFSVRLREAMNPSSLGSSNGFNKQTSSRNMFERETTIRDAGITPAMIEKLRRAGLYISDRP